MDALSSRYSLANILDWSCGGVNGSIAGNGGPECAGFLTPKWRFVETVCACVISLWYFMWGYSYITYPTVFPFVRKDRGGKRLLLVLVSMTFGIEIGFKFASRQLIYLLNPCHITTAIQIYLLAAPPSKLVTTVLRVHLNFLNGPIMAILFPVTNARLLPFEVEIYWIQHLMMLVTPYYLLRLGGVYTVEDLRDISWTVMSLGILLLYHFLPLQIIGLATQVNLNNMLCPAISDPFYGPNYRIAALVHQSICVPLIAKSFCFGANFFITKFGPTKIKDQLETDVTMSCYQSYLTSSSELPSPEAEVYSSGAVHPLKNGLPGSLLYLHRRTKSETVGKREEKSQVHRD